MIVVVQRQWSQNIVVLVAGLAIVTSVLLVPVVAVGIALCSVLCWRVDITAVHVGIGEFGSLMGSERCADLGELGLDAGRRRDEGPRQWAGRYNAPGEHAIVLLELGLVAIEGRAYVAALLRG